MVAWTGNGGMLDKFWRQRQLHLLIGWGQEKGKSRTPRYLASVQKDRVFIYGDRERG